MRTPLLFSLILAALLGLSACSAQAAPAAPAADITISDAGCPTTQFFLPNTRQPEISVANQADIPMVFSIPTMNRWVTVAPHAEAPFVLPRYIMGSFDFFCLSEAEHTRIGGGNPLLCSLEPRDLAVVARSRGTFEIEHHNRIQEVLQKQP